jgi:ComF family protein
LCKKCVQEFRIKLIKAKSLYPSYEEFQYLDGVIYGADYAENPGLRSAIAQFKYKFNKQLTDYFAALVSQKMTELGMLKHKEAVLIPVPLHKKRLNHRGFNQAELIANASAAKVGDGVCVLTLLSRIKNTSQQAKLSKVERHENLKEAFEVMGDLSDVKDRICFVVDDVCTTGATLDSCAQVLKENGIKKVYGLVVARAFK